ncbi:hypothetical protein [Streptomyces sp. NBC_00199]|uniref:hypothetical protein n=1 Tax=Streptomyces sp. NBC_00199 TaxID=2975678 RepID=UPI00224C8DDA|nr:hypothetical protein [Streptomyces sp. NBC_00199]MCX5269397.1 hypothetical protein [Streptomyces sp. NBC_00199]
MYSPPPDPDAERRMRAHHARAAAGVPAWLRLVCAPEDKASGKLWDGALDAQHVLGDLDGHRPALLGVHDAFDDGTAYRAELSGPRR